MRVLILGSHLKVMSKAVRLLSKYSREVNFNANEEGILLQSANITNSAFVEIFLGKNFFHEYFGGDPFVPFECKIDIKSLVLVFRVINLDRIIEQCKILMDNRICKIFFEMKGKHKVTRFYNIPYMEHEFVACPKVSEVVGSPSLKAPARLFNEIFKNFTLSTKEATLWMFDDNIRFKTFIEKCDKKYLKTPITSFVYRARDFSLYNYSQQLSISFNIKDLTPFFDFAIYKNQNISAYFQTEAKPIEFSFHSPNDSYRANIVLATFEFPPNEGPVPPPYDPRIVHDSSQNRSINESVDFLSLPSPEPGDDLFGFFSNIRYAATNLPANRGIPFDTITQKSNLNVNSNEDINITQNNQNNPELPTQNANYPNLRPDHGFNPEDDFPNSLSVIPESDISNIREIIDQLPDFSKSRENNSSVVTQLSGHDLVEFKRTYLHGLDESQYDSEVSHFASSSDEDTRF